MKAGIYNLKEKVWLYPGVNPWHFVNVSKKISDDIDKKYGKFSRGFGSLRVEVTVGKSKWNTSIFPDKKLGVYILPLKSQIRKQENISAGDLVSYTLKIVK